MSDENESAAADESKKPKHRKPLWLLIPAGERHIDSPEGPYVEPIFVVHRCDSMADVNKIIARKQFDAANMPKGMLLLRADPKIPDVGTQLVVKW